MNGVARSPAGASARTLRATRSEARTRDLALALGLSEAELVAASIGYTAVRLDDSVASLLHALPEVGRCVAVTRNASAVSEVRGRYRGVALGRDTGQVTGDRIDLRLVVAHWRYLFAIDEPDPRRPGERRRSIQVFDAAGAAVHEVCLDPGSDPRTWDAVVATRTVTAPRVIEPVRQRIEPVGDAPDPRIDRAALLADWDALADLHELDDLLARHRVTRTQALRLLGTSRARPVQRGAIDRVLDRALDHAPDHAPDRALDHAPRAGGTVTIRVANRGCTQAYSGAVQRVARRGPWLEVEAPDVHVQLRTDHIAESWIVAMPTAAGVVLALELFDPAGEVIATVLRDRHGRDGAEHPGWRSVLEQLAEVAP